MKKVLTDEEKRERKKKYNLKYRNTENGSRVTKEYSKKYQQTDEYKEYRNAYMKKRYQEQKLQKNQQQNLL